MKKLILYTKIKCEISKDFYKKILISGSNEIFNIETISFTLCSQKQSKMFVSMIGKSKITVFTITAFLNGKMELLKTNNIKFIFQ